MATIYSTGITVLYHLTIFKALHLFLMAKRGKGPRYGGPEIQNVYVEGTDARNMGFIKHYRAHNKPPAYDSTVAKTVLTIVGVLILAMLFWLESKGY